MLESRQCLSEHGSPAKGCENVIDARTKEMPIWKHARCVRGIVKDLQIGVPRQHLILNQFTGFLQSPKAWAHLLCPSCVCGIDAFYAVLERKSKINLDVSFFFCNFAPILT